MCGIAGVLNFINLRELDFVESLKCIKHRGPDDQGVFFNKIDKIALGNTRLAIQDLSNNGALPIRSFSNRYLLAYNGEIYNFRQLKIDIFDSYKKKKINFSWKSNSDAEVLINGIELYGLERMLEKIDGMFAFALWDSKDKKLFIARDKFGEKPLYYGFLNNVFYFSSELSFIKSIVKTKLKINKDSVSLMINYGFIPASQSIYENFEKLAPSTYIEISRNNTYTKKKYKKNLFLNKKQTWNNSTLNDATSLIDKILKKTIANTLTSDVKISSFLSSGLDSSLVSFYAQNLSNTKIDTYCLITDEPLYNEGEEARKIAKSIKSNYNEIKIGDDDVIDFFQKSDLIYTEPFGDSSQVPTYVIAREVSKKNKVILSGDGGDEIFGGYNRYYFQKYFYNNFFFNNIFTKKLFFILKNLNFEKINNKNILNINYWKIGTKLHKIINSLSSKSNTDLLNYYYRSSNYAEMFLKRDFRINFSEIIANDNQKINIKDLMKLDQTLYLPDDICCKVDRASMFNSLEVRSPFLSCELFEATLGMPEKFFVGNNQKVILRNLYKKYFGINYSGKKKGFSIPVKKYLKKNLKDLSYELLSDKNLNLHEYFNNILLKKEWEIFQNNENTKPNIEYTFWNILIFQKWYLSQ